MSVELLGADKVIARLAKRERAMDPATVKSLLEIAKLIRNEAKRRVPVDTGALRQSIRLQRYAKKAGHIHTTGVSAGGYIVNPKTNQIVNYAKFVEYGTSRQFSQPFMRPAMLMYKDMLPRKIKDEVMR